MLNVEKIYVVHYTRLVERKFHMDSFFRNNQIKAEYILPYDQELLTDDILREYYRPIQEEYEKKILGLYGKDSNPFRHLRKSEISCTIKHYHAIKKLGEEVKDYGLIFEDDVMFADDFCTLFNKYLDKTPSDWDAIFFGSCCGLDVEKGNDDAKIAFLKQHPATKCADGYLLRKELAQKISSTMKPFVTISDWELAYHLHLHDAKVYWWSPPLIAQGSEHGLFKSTLR